MWRRGKRVPVSLTVDEEQTLKKLCREFNLSESAILSRGLIALDALLPEGRNGAGSRLL